MLPRFFFKEDRAFWSEYTPNGLKGILQTDSQNWLLCNRLYLFNKYWIFLKWASFVHMLQPSLKTVRKLFQEAALHSFRICACLFLLKCSFSFRIIRYSSVFFDWHSSALGGPYSWTIQRYAVNLQPTAFLSERAFTKDVTLLKKATVMFLYVCIESVCIYI